MSLTKRGDYWHYSINVDGKQFRATTGFKRKADAQAFEEQRRREAKLGTLHRPVPTLEDVAERWFAARVKGRKSEATIRIRLDIMLRLVGRDTRISAIGSREVEDAMAARRMEATYKGTPPSNATVNIEIVSTLRPVLKYAARVLEEKTKAITWADLLLHEEPGRERMFTSEELQAWRAALPIWHRQIFDFLGRYGPRLREAFFALDRIDLDAGEVHIRAADRKNGAHTIVLIDEDVALFSALVGRARAAGIDTVWFRPMKGGRLKPITARAFQCASCRALEAANVTDAKPAHDLRHHAATTFLAATHNLKLVQQLLGHANIASTMRYAHADKSSMRAALHHTYSTKAPAPPENTSEVAALPRAVENI